MVQGIKLLLASIIICISLTFISSVICNPSLPNGCPQEANNKLVNTGNITNNYYNNTYINQTANLSGYVPYTGATGDVDLGYNTFKTSKGFSIYDTLGDGEGITISEVYPGAPGTKPRILFTGTSKIKSFIFNTNITAPNLCYSDGSNCQASGSTYNSTYNTWAYNQTTPAINYVNNISCLYNGTNCQPSGSGNPFDQSLNTTDDVTFNSVTETVPTNLKLDQSTPQTVANGVPIFSSGLNAFNLYSDYLCSQDMTGCLMYSNGAGAHYSLNQPLSINMLLDAGTYMSVAPTDRYLYGASNLLSVDWGNRILYASNGGTPALNWESGNVLVNGVADVGYNLNIAGTFRVGTGAGGAADALRMESNGDVIIGSTSDDGFNFKVSGSTALAADSGNVLIGTTTDDGVKLHIAGNAVSLNNGASPASFYLGPTDTGHGAVFEWTNNGVEDIAQFVTFAYANPFYMDASKLVMQSNSGGNVLIGTTTDDGVNKLQVSGNIAANTLNSNFDSNDSTDYSEGVNKFNVTRTWGQPTDDPFSDPMTGSNTNANEYDLTINGIWDNQGDERVFNVRGINNVYDADTSASLGALRGMNFATFNYGTVNIMDGAQGEVTTQGTPTQQATTGSQYGIVMASSIYDYSTVTLNEGTYNYVSTDGSHTTLTNQIGMFMENHVTGGANVTNNAGLIISDVIGGTKTNIAISTGKGLVQFGDNVNATANVTIGKTLSVGNGLNMNNKSITNVDTLYVHNITGRSPIYINGDAIFNGAIYTLPETGVAKSQYAMELANTTLISQQDYALKLISTAKQISDFAYGERLELKILRLTTAGELAQELIKDNQQIASAKILEAKKIALINTNPIDEALIESTATTELNTLNDIAEQQAIIINNSLTDAIGNITASDNPLNRYAIQNRNVTFENVQGAYYSSDGSEGITDITGFTVCNDKRDRYTIADFGTSDVNGEFVWTGAIINDAHVYSNGVATLKYRGVNVENHQSLGWELADVVCNLPRPCIQETFYSNSGETPDDESWAIDGDGTEPIGTVVQDTDVCESYCTLQIKNGLIAGCN